MTDNSNTKRVILGCTLAAVLTFGVAMIVVVGGMFLVNRAFTTFDAYRDMMCIRNGLVVKDDHLRYSPGIDAAMWSRFSVKVNGIDEVFDGSMVDTSEFSQDGYEIRVDWINDVWWDVDSQQLIGGEVQVEGNWMRVGYVDNGDGTLTVYIFWFEV